MGWLDELDELLDENESHDFLGEAPETPKKKENENLVLLVDGDIIAYSSAFACQESFVLAVKRETNESYEFGNKTLAKNKLGERFEEFEIVELARTATEEALFTTIRSQIESYKKRFKTSRVEIYVNGQTNFRYVVPLPTRYKSNRGSAKPQLLSRAQAILRDHFNAISVDGIEADDAVSMRQHELNKEGVDNIVITVDKDAMQCEGKVFNPRNLRLTTVDKFGSLRLKNSDSGKKLVGTGLVWLLAQIIMGDKVDGYLPSDLHGKRVGPVATYKYLAGATGVNDAWKRAFNAYKDLFGGGDLTWTDHYGVVNTGSYLDIMQMYATCAFMLRNGNHIDIHKIYAMVENGIEVPHGGLGESGE